MKQIRKIQIIALVFMMILGCSALTIKAEAAKKKAKSKVSWKLKKGTLTIKGKGAMPESMRFQKQKKKIKKVIIKKGITSVPDKAFYHCKKIKSVKLPKTLKKIGYKSFAETAISKIVVPSSVRRIGGHAFEDCISLKHVTMPGDIKTETQPYKDAHNMLSWKSKLKSLTFTTKLSLLNAARFYTDNLYVWEEDSNYKSVNGVIYTKDGRSLVRVPSNRKSLVIEHGCTEFALESILYCLYDTSTDPLGGCDYLKEITIPESVSRIVADKYAAGNTRSGTEWEMKVTIKSKKLDGHSIMAAISGIMLKDSYTRDFYTPNCEAWSQLLPGQIIKSADRFVTYDGVLLRYFGKADKVSVAAGTKEIGINAFYDNEFVKTVELPESITEIGNGAFEGCDKLSVINIPKGVTRIGGYAFGNCMNLKEISLHENIKSFGVGAFYSTAISEIRLPANMKHIPERMFASSGLESIVIPDSVETIGEYAFENTPHLKKVVLGKGVKTIREFAFNESGLKQVTIPANVLEIYQYAFSASTQRKEKLKVTVMGPLEKIEDFAFGDENAVITYKASIKEYKTSLTYREWRKKGKKQYISCHWNQLTGISGYQLKVSPDKKFKKGVKTVNVKKNKVSLKMVYKGKKHAVYAKIRPYKIKNGKKIYGKWTKASI